MSFQSLSPKSEDHFEMGLCHAKKYNPTKSTKKESHKITILNNTNLDQFKVYDENDHEDYLQQFQIIKLKLKEKRDHLNYLHNGNPELEQYEIKKLVSKEIQKTEEYKTFLKFKSRSKQFLINSLATKIEGCPFLPTVHLDCQSCDGQLTKKPIKLTCLANFCKDPQCLKTRILVRKMKLQEYHIKSKNIYSFVIGFKSIDKKELTKSLRLKYHKAFKLSLKKLEKVYGKFYYLSVRDLNQSNDGKVRVHYHVATLPLKDFRFFSSSLKNACSEVGSKTGLYVAPSFSGYRKTSATLEYFSKRASGDFGHNRNDEIKFGFSDFMTIEKYYDVFYKSKTFNSNFSFRSREATSEFIMKLNSVPKICPHCNVPTKNNTIMREVNPNPPPDNNLIVNSQKSYPVYEIVNPEVIKIC